MVVAPGENDHNCEDIEENSDLNIAFAPQT